MSRRIVQVIDAGPALLRMVLCEDGTVWQLHWPTPLHTPKWRMLMPTDETELHPPIPELP